MFHRVRDSIEAHLTIVFTALAVSREVQARTGLAIGNVARQLRPLRSATIAINGAVQTFPPVIPTDQQQILDDIQTPEGDHALSPMSEVRPDEERRLRGALKLIATASAEQPRKDEHRVPHRTGRPGPAHRMRWTVISAAAAVVLVGSAGTALLVNRSDDSKIAGASSVSGGPAGGEVGQTVAEGIACSRAIAVGDVVKVAGANSPRVTVTMQVTEWISPDHGSPTLVFSDRNPKLDGVWPAWQVGGRFLVIIPSKRSDEAVNSFQGKQLTWTRHLILGSLKDASTTSCSPMPTESAGQR